MDRIQKIGFYVSIISWLGYQCFHNSIFLIVFSLAMSVVFLGDIKKEESHILLDLFMIGLITVATIKVLFF